jgi:phosphonate transport system ATP-binding protein
MLEVRGISKKLPGGCSLLKDISFAVKNGEFVGILGPSGAGKSLTIRCILGLTKPDGGRVILTDSDGASYNITESSGKRLRYIRQKIGVVFQGFHLVKRLTVVENVMIGRLGRISPLRSWIYGFTDEEAQKALEVLAKFNMDSFAQRVVGTLSGGEMQRVAVCRAIYQEPIIMLADEPIGSLDPRNSHEIMNILKPISEQIPVCGVFHQPEITAKYCTRVIGIREGEIVYDGSPKISKSKLNALYGEELQEHIEGKNIQNGQKKPETLDVKELLIEG